MFDVDFEPLKLTEMASIVFKDDRQRLEWNDSRLNPLLKRIVSESANASTGLGWVGDFMLTSIYRTPEEDKAYGGTGVHTAWRAVDVRTSGQSAAAIAAVTKFANDKWIYDPARPKLEVCDSSPHGTGPHLHFQTHPQTEART